METNGNTGCRVGKRNLHPWLGGVSSADGKFAFVGRLRSLAHDFKGEFVYYALDSIRQESLSRTSPVVLCVQDQTLQVGNWRDVLKNTLDILGAIDRKKLKNVAASSGNSWIGFDGSAMRAPRSHPSGVVVDVWHDASGILRISKTLFNLCGFPLDFVGVVYSRTALPRARDGEDADIRVFGDDIRRNYPGGFDFSDAAMRLVSMRVGKEFSAETALALKRRMFERQDGMWFFPGQICTKASAKSLLDGCSARLDEYPLLVLRRAAAIASAGLSRLDCDFDQGKFVEFLISNDSRFDGFDFDGKRAGRIVFRKRAGADAAKAELAGAVREFLERRGDAVALSEIADAFPVVTEDWLRAYIPGLVKDAVILDIEPGGEAFKLVEHFYLPDDFASSLETTISSMKEAGEVPSAGAIISAMNRHYGFDLAADFGMTQDVFKQIAVVFGNGAYNWIGAVLDDAGAAGAGERMTFAETVARRFPEMFTHNEFFGFGQSVWGWGEEHRLWHHKQLWRNFIRYDADNWSGVEFFMDAIGGAGALDEFVRTLKSLLGGDVFYPLNRIGRETLESLSPLRAGGRTLKWTKELVASVAFHCVKSLTVLNHAEGNNVVTAYLAPPEVPKSTDGIEYAVHVFRLRNPFPPPGEDGGDAYVRMAVDFLIENSVRQNVSRKLRRDVAAMLAKERFL